MYNVSITQKATIELNQSINWYNEQKKGLGKRFYNKVKEAIKTIAKNPYSFELRYKEIRALPVEVFPFVIAYFIVEPNKIVITAVFHSSRNPENL